MTLNIKKYVLILATSVAFVLAIGILSEPVSAHHHPNHEGTTCETQILGFPVWYRYLKIDKDTCEVLIPADGFMEGNIPWLVAAAVVEILLRVATYVAVVFVFWGGFQIMTSSGTPESVAQGKNKILGGIFGLIIGIMAASVVGYIMNQLIGLEEVGITPQGLPDVGDSGDGVIAFILNLVYRLAAGVAVIYVALAGFNFATSGGDSQKVAKARNSIIFAVAGLAITLLAFAIITMVGNRL